MKRVALGVVVLLAGLLAAILAFAWFGNYNPAPVEPVVVGCTGAPPSIEVGVPFRVISWNLRQGASRRRPLPDEGGSTTPVPIEDVEQTLATITAALENEAAQIYLLQEVDRNSRRTHNIDQLEQYLTFATDRCHAAAAVPPLALRARKWCRTHRTGRHGARAPHAGRRPIGHSAPASAPRRDAGSSASSTSSPRSSSARSRSKGSTRRSRSR